MTHSTTKTALPGDVAFYHAVLRFLDQHPDGEHRQKIKDALPDLLNLTEAQRSERTVNRLHIRYRYEADWALSMLKMGQYVDNPARGVWRITKQGRDLLAKYPDEFSGDVVKQLRRELRMARKIRPGDKPEIGTETVGELTPDQQIEAALDEIRQIVEQELLDRIVQAPPTFFETLVLQLLYAMGYGSSEDDIERVGGAGDGGIDGIISLDKLGFERVYVQAKRWQGSVGRPEVQAFYGALAGRRAKKGVFITTSSFTREAREYAAHLTERIVLIDGSRLASLMIDHGVGVSYYREVRLPRVDEDYFESG